MGDVKRHIRPVRVGHLTWRFEVEDSVRGNETIIPHGFVRLHSVRMPELRRRPLHGPVDYYDLYLPGTRRDRDADTVQFPDSKVELAAMGAITRANNKLALEEVEQDGN